MEQITSFFANLFTQEQQTALAIITIAVMVATQSFKKIYFGFHPVRSITKKRAIIWSVAVLFGALCGAVGYFVAVPEQALWFWLFVGVSSGGIAIGAFDLLVSVDWLHVFRLRRKDSGNKTT